jgi:hypothetical protein
MPLSLRWRSLIVPKDGHAFAEYEDAVAGHPGIGRFAVADGASESYAAGEWARHLVTAFVRQGPADDWLAAPREAWRREIEGGELSWYAEDKLARGAHATFLGVRFTVAEDHADWEAIAVGDACLFLLRDEARPFSFPLTSSTEFTSSPAFVRTRDVTPQWKTDRGSLRPGEAMLLTTDALAQFLMTSAEAGDFAGAGLRDVEEDAFALWIQAMRSLGRMRNDDVALGVIEIG